MSHNDNTPIDEALQIRMGYTKPEAGENRELIVDFNKQISWLAFTKETGVKFAEELIKRLEDL